MKIIQPSFEIVDMADYQEILKKLEKIGRVCYKSENNITDDSAERFLASIIKRGHESVIEHENVTVKLIVDRGVSHEIVRHRIASYSQESTRYCNYSESGSDDGISIISTSGFMFDKKFKSLDEYSKQKIHQVWLEAQHYAESCYKEMIELGATPQLARSVLTNSTKTEIVITMNLRAWRNFFKLRTPHTAHPQMREIAIIGLDKFKGALPVFFEDIEVAE